MKEKFHLFLSSFCFLGYAPYASGTVGTMGGVALYVLWHVFSLSKLVYILGTLFLFFIGVWTSTHAELITRKKDSSIIVIDEVVGYLVTMAFIPLTLPYLIVGFILNRVLDIIKPFPANWAQKKLSRGWAVMMDDVISGFYAYLIMQMIVHIF